MAEPAPQLKGTPTGTKNGLQRSVNKQSAGTNNMYMSPPQSQKTKEVRTRNTGGPGP